MRENKLLQLWLIIAIITGFGAVIFFSIIYLNETVLCNQRCVLKYQIYIILTLLSLFGIFVGSLTYYLISESFQKKIKKINKNVNSTLKFLSKEERKIVETLINNQGEISQNKIAEKTGFTRVKVTRVLNQLKEKSIITKKKEGKVNIVKLKEEIYEVFN